MHWVEVVGPERSLKLFGVKLVGISASGGKKLLFTAIVVAAVLILRALLRPLVHRLQRSPHRVRFWLGQLISIALAFILIVGVVSIWFESSGQATTFVGLVTAGVAFALQKVITSFAGYLVILRGRIFHVGDRITMGGVRGDVIAVGFLQTRIMEMGQPPAVEPNADPAMWIQARQYTGRIVAISNDKIFDEPVYNYTREFPFIWEEIRIPVQYGADRGRAEKILLEAAHRHTVDVKHLSAEAVEALEHRYVVAKTEMGPRVYYRLTDNWLELAVRFIVPDHGVRDIKDAMYRDILAAFEQAGLQIASSTFEVVGLPKVQVALAAPTGHAEPPDHGAPRH